MHVTKFGGSGGIMTTAGLELPYPRYSQGPSLGARLLGGGSYNKSTDRIPAGDRHCRQWRQIRKSGARNFHLAKISGDAIFKNNRQKILPSIK